MAGAKFTKGQRIEIRSLVANFDRLGYGMTEIAVLLRERHGYEMTPQMVAGYRKQVWAAYAKREEECRAAQVAEKREQYRMIRKLAWEAWDRSQEDGTRVVEETERVLVPVGGDPSGALESAERVRRIITCEGRLPDNAYLKTILDTLRAEREMMGLDAEKVGAGTNVNVGVNVQQVSIEQLTRSFKEQAMLEARSLVEGAVEQVRPVNGLKELPPADDGGAGLNGQHREPDGE